MPGVITDTSSWLNILLRWGTKAWHWKLAGICVFWHCSAKWQIGFPSYVELIRLVWSGDRDGLQLQMSWECLVYQFSASLADNSCLLSAGRRSERVLTHFPLRFLVCRAFSDASVIQVDLVNLYQQWTKYVSLCGSKSETAVGINRPVLPSLLQMLWQSMSLKLSPQRGWKNWTWFRFCAFGWSAQC